MRLYVGQAQRTGDLRRYAGRFNFLELPAERGMPRPATLRRWTEEVGADFAFSVVLPESVSALDGKPDEEEVARALDAAETLGAHWLLLRTPPTARPSARTRRRLAELVARLPRAEGRRIAWDPRGLWEDEDAERQAAELGVCLVRDVSRSDAPPGDVVYARLRALGAGGRVSGGAVERAIDEIEGHERAYVVVEGDAAARAARMLRAALAGAEPSAMDDSDEEGYEEGAEDDDQDDGHEED